MEKYVLLLNERMKTADGFDVKEGIDVSQQTRFVDINYVFDTLINIYDRYFAKYICDIEPDDNVNSDGKMCNCNGIKISNIREIDVDELLQEGAYLFQDINDTDQYDGLISWLIYNHDIDNIKKYLKEGTEKGFKLWDYIMKEIIPKYGTVEILKVFVELGVFNPESMIGTYAFAEAVYADNIEIAEYLAENGADVLYEDDLIDEASSDEMVELLVKYGCV